MDDFRKEVLKVNKSRVHKVNNSLGTYDAYKWLRKNKWLDVGPISEHDYYTIIRISILKSSGAFSLISFIQ